MTDVTIGFQILLLSIIILYAIFLYKSRLRPKVIRRAALIILAAGTLVHMYGFSLEPFREGIFTLFFRSLIMTIKMFVYDHELCELGAAQRTPLFLDLFFFVFYAAMLTSLSAIIMLFGKRAMTLFSLFFRKKKFSHVFIGVNSRSEIIASGIDNEEIAFIEFPSDEESKISLSSVMGGMAKEEKKEKRKQRHNVSTLRAKRKLRLSETEGNVFATIGLDRLKRLTDNETAFYILSEDNDRNLNELMALLSDDSLTENTIHVCVSRQGVSRYYKTILKGTGTHFIYTSSMAVVEMMKTASCHPASVMTPALTAEGQPTGGVIGEFNALIIGFGETGQAVTKFLYEFSAAVNADGTPIPVKIIINDDRIDSLKGPFIFDSPELSHSGILEYENTGTDSSEFWDKLVSRLDKLNYIAISMKDDAMNLDLACTIFMYAMKKRTNGLNGLRIVVRKKNTLPHERRLVEKMNEKAGHEVIVCYGEYDKIFTPSMIISKSKTGINKNATGLADTIGQAYTNVSGKTIKLHGKSESFHEKNHMRMEMHQLISRANHVPSLAAMTCSKTEVSAETLENLARMEHLRYSRYLAAHGYSYAEEDDDVYKTNHQIAQRWESLTEEDRQYHRDMVLAQLSTVSN